VAAGRRPSWRARYFPAASWITSAAAWGVQAALASVSAVTSSWANSTVSAGGLARRSCASEPSSTKADAAARCARPVAFDLRFGDLRGLHEEQRGAKSRAGRGRRIWLDAETLRLLREHRETQYWQPLRAGDAWTDKDLVLCLAVFKIAVVALLIEVVSCSVANPGGC
jgi:hypothetical protein